MTFAKEPNAYEKSVLSNLQGSWEVLRSTVVENFGFTNSEKLLFHFNEGMSWERVRKLELMKETLLLVRNIAIQSSAPQEVMECIEMVTDNLAEVFDAINEGENI